MLVFIVKPTSSQVCTITLVIVSFFHSLGVEVEFYYYKPSKGKMLLVFNRNGSN